MLKARLLRLDDQAHEHTHDHHQLVLSLAGRAEFEVNGRGGEVCRMRACLVPGDADHQFAGIGDNRMLIIDLNEQGTSSEDLELEVVTNAWWRNQAPIRKSDIRLALDLRRAKLG